tara:strand:- start:18 stop:1118 length:1101 start_codon:yes stop_codon:yes gene_type:complete
MGLAVTVQKGHDFSSGTIDRAALNNGATPTVSITGSVGLGEIGSEAIVNDNIKTNADIAVSKLALTEGSLILGDSNGDAAALAPSSSYNHDTLGNEADKNCGLLIDTGTNKWQVLNTDVSVGGQVSITKYRANSNSSFILKLKVVNESLSASHINKDTTLDMASLAKNSGGKLCVADNGVHWDKFYNHKNSAGNLRSAFLSYGVDGKAIPSEITEADQVLVSAGSNANSTNKSFFKNVDLLTPLVDSTGWKRAAHGLGRVPLFVELFLVCTGTTHTSTHKYAVNDVIKAHHEWSNTEAHNKSNPFNVGFDGTYVWVHHLALGDVYQFPKKYGTATPDENTHSGSDVGIFDLGAVEGDFKLVARVCG